MKKIVIAVLAAGVLVTGVFGRDGNSFTSDRYQEAEGLPLLKSVYQSPNGNKKMNDDYAMLKNWIRSMQKCPVKNEIGTLTSFKLEKNIVRREFVFNKDTNNTPEDFKDEVDVITRLWCNIKDLKNASYDGVIVDITDKWPNGVVKHGEITGNECRKLDAEQDSVSRRINSWKLN